MRFIVLISCILFSFSAFARSPGDVLSAVYPAFAGCIESTVTTTGHNRSAQLDAKSYYLLYGTDNTAVGTFEAIECAQGDSAVDVTGLAGSLEGLEIAAGEKILIYTGNNNRYVSCISASASKHYHLCKSQQ